MTTGMPRV